MNTAARDTHWREALLARLSPAAVFRGDEPLAKRTTLRVGGPADAYVEPASIEDLAAVLRFCAELRLPHFVLGRGSNLLVKDTGFRGVVINLSQPCFSRIEAKDGSLVCGAGARLKAVAAEAKRLALAAGALGGGISGSGPSIFMLNQDEATAHAAAAAMGSVYRKMGIDFHLHVGPIASQGARVVASA